MENSNQTPSLDVVIEIPRGGFVKRYASGAVLFISPLPCLFNYGYVPGYWGLDDDLLDAVVLGPRRSRGSRLKVNLHGAIGLSDHGEYDDKLICGLNPPGAVQRVVIVCFFHCYALFKRMLNYSNGKRGRTACEGWSNGVDALARAKPPCG